MKIGIDIDDTIGNFYEVAFAYAQKYTIEELGRDATVREYTAMHHDYLNFMHNWNHEEDMNFWHRYYEEIVKLEKPFTFAVETIANLHEEGHEIIIVTARWAEYEFDVKNTTIDWLNQNKIVYDEFVFNASDKAKVAVEKELDVFIDDSFQNCINVANKGIHTFLMDTRNNRDLSDEKITRVYSWSDIYNRIKKEEMF